MFPRFAVILGAASGTFAFAGAIDFSRDIQPILSENCYHCHGPDAKARKAHEAVFEMKTQFAVRSSFDFRNSARAAGM